MGQMFDFLMVCLEKGKLEAKNVLVFLSYECNCIKVKQVVKLKGNQLEDKDREGDSRYIMVFILKCYLQFNASLIYSKGIQQEKMEQMTRVVQSKLSKQTKFQIRINLKSMFRINQFKIELRRVNIHN